MTGQQSVRRGLHRLARHEHDQSRLDPQNPMSFVAKDGTRLPLQTRAYAGSEVVTSFTACARNISVSIQPLCGTVVCYRADRL